MELLQFRYFLEAAKYEHMTRAAQSLHIAQPALTQSIKRLEKELGIELFDRENHRVALNENGRFLQQRLIPIMASIDNLPYELQRNEEEVSHLIHLDIQVASALITRCIIDYKKKIPNVHFQTRQGFEDDYGDIMISSTYTEDENYHSRLILEEDFYLAVPNASPLATHPSIHLIEAAHEGFITLDRSHPIRQICDTFCLTAGFEPRIIFESDNPDSVRDLIAAGLGIAFWPIKTWGHLSTPEVTLLPIDSPVCTRDIYMTSTKAARQNPVVDDFYHFISSHVNGHLSN